MIPADQVFQAQATVAEPLYVFGTDLAGNQDYDSAVLAVRFHGTEAGKWSGPSGNSYPIPYRNTTRRLLPLRIIANYVESLFAHARERPDLRFRVARFGCEQDAYEDADMAKLFRAAPANVALPALWRRTLDATQPIRLLAFDPAGAFTNEACQDRIRTYLAINAPLWGTGAVEIVSVGTSRNIVANDRLAKLLRLKHRVVQANPHYYGEHAASAVLQQAVWYSTHLLCICDLDHTAPPEQVRMISHATRGGLFMDQIDPRSNDD